MATIKSYSDLQQSRKLAEILPLESADICYVCGNTTLVSPTKYGDTSIEKLYKKHIIPAWSLAALLGVLPMIRKDEDVANPFIAKASDNEYYVVYATLIKEVDSSGIYDNPVDACYEMILKLHKLNLL